MRIRSSGAASRKRLRARRFEPGVGTTPESSVGDVKAEKDRKPQRRLVGRKNDGCEFALGNHDLVKLILHYADDEPRMFPGFLRQREPDIAGRRKRRPGHAAERRQLALDQQRAAKCRGIEARPQFPVRIDPGAVDRGAMTRPQPPRHLAAMLRLCFDDLEVRHHAGLLCFGTSLLFAPHMIALSQVSALHRTAFARVLFVHLIARAGVIAVKIAIERS
jgi:hypothetical protein